MTCLGPWPSGKWNEIKVFCLAEKFTNWPSGPVLSNEEVKNWDSTATGWKDFTWGVGNIIYKWHLSIYCMCDNTANDVTRACLWSKTTSENKGIHVLLIHYSFITILITITSLDTCFISNRVQQTVMSTSYCSSEEDWCWLVDKFVIEVLVLKAAKYEIQKPSTCCATTHALCTSLTPTDLKLWLHAFRLISHA